MAEEPDHSTTINSVSKAVIPVLSDIYRRRPHRDMVVDEEVPHEYESIARYSTPRGLMTAMRQVARPDSLLTFLVTTNSTAGEVTEPRIEVPALSSETASSARRRRIPR